MANIPVEPKGGGMPWWAWLLALLAVIGLIWLIAEMVGDDEPEVAAVDPIEEPVDPVDFDCPAVGADMITSVDQVTDAGGADLVGCEVDLNGMNVLTLTGDSSFFAAPTPGAAEGMLIVLQGLNESESLPPPATGRDGEYNVDEGDVVNIDGEIAAFDETVPDYADMPSEDRDRALSSGIYVNANNVEGVGDTDVETPTQ